MKTMQQIKIPNHYYSNQYSFYKIVCLLSKNKKQRFSFGGMLKRTVYVQQFVFRRMCYRDVLLGSDAFSSGETFAVTSSQIDQPLLLQRGCCLLYTSTHSDSKFQSLPPFPLFLCLQHKEWLQPERKKNCNLLRVHKIKSIYVYLIGFLYIIGDKLP